jgi:hypothetical protein
MSTLSTTRNYATGVILYQSDFDTFLDDIETFFNTTKITDGNIQGQGIDGSLKLGEASITTAKIVNDAVTTIKIGDSEVNTVNINAAAVTTAKFIDAGVTTAKIADAGVTTAKIADNVISLSKRINVNYSLNTINTTVTVASSTTTDIISTSITTSGRPVYIVMYNPFFASIGRSSFSNYSTNVQILRDSTVISNNNIAANFSTPSEPANRFTCYISNGCIKIIDEPATGTYTYKIRVITGDGSFFSLGSLYLYAVEL